MKLISCCNWEAVKAVIHVRNCIANLPVKLKVITTTPTITATPIVTTQHRCVLSIFIVPNT